MPCPEEVVNRISKANRHMPLSFLRENAAYWDPKFVSRTEYFCLLLIFD